MPNPQNIAAASFWPGLQNVGQTSGEAHITGTLNGSPSGISATSSNMTGTVFVSLPDPTVISLFRVNIPEIDSAIWVPLFGSAEIWNNTGSNNYKLIIYVGSASSGRNFYLNFVNASTSSVSVDIHLNIYGHLYTYPF